jgi:hypothetical protein
MSEKIIFEGSPAERQESIKGGFMLKITEEKKQNSNLSIRINAGDLRTFKRKCKERNRDASEVLRSLISMVNNETIEVERK